MPSFSVLSGLKVFLFPSFSFSSLASFLRKRIEDDGEGDEETTFHPALVSQIPNPFRNYPKQT